MGDQNFECQYIRPANLLVLIENKMAPDKLMNMNIIVPGI